MPQGRALRERSHELLEVKPGEVVLDVGCGTGHAVAELTSLGARAIGVDAGDALSFAKEWFPSCDFRNGSAENLPVESSSVDCYRAQRLYHLLAEPSRALAEARRVLVPWGRIALIGQDYDMWAVASDAPERTRALLHTYAQRMSTPNGGLKYRELLLDNGFTDVRVEVHTAVHSDHAALAPLLKQIAASDADDWLDEQADRGARGRFLAVLPSFLVVGVRAAAQE
ncbi:methyltransferase domain-containing protein [Allokutzneria albata]|uniref:Methyltransferase domain-containing protein n=1 Tax=Allokutzneria albata TaxID=211114 RepID=A0A1H0CWL7_ALLAB|nr:methyltransferase domain-containing protein [Allokutzneria albata]SDN62313.1 Methyltransferase domain-containing protein [Allokutzneria albata]